MVFVYNKKTNKQVAFFTADTKKIVFDIVGKSKYSDPDKYEHSMVEEVVKFG